MRCIAGLCWVVTAALMAGCAVPPSSVQAPTREVAGLPVPDIPSDAPGQRLLLDAAQSSLRIHVFRGGRAANLGHNHVLSAPRLTGLLLLPVTEAGAPDWSLSRLELTFRLDELALDLPALRAALGPGWASQLSPEAVAATRANMLGEGNLQAERFPLVRMRSLRVAGVAPKLAVEVEVELHGQRRSQWLAVTLGNVGDGSSIKASGALVLRQSDFGIASFSVLGGLLAVQDELLIEFELLAQTSPSNGSTSTNSPASTSP
jgi:hypothetical protein